MQLRPVMTTRLLLLAGILGVLDAIGVATRTVHFHLATLSMALLAVPLLAWGIWRGYHDHRPLPFSTRARAWARRAAIAGLVTTVVLAITPLLVIRDESKQNVDYLLVLGAGLSNRQVTATLADRLDCGLRWLATHPDTPVIVSGGQGSDENRTEADAMAEYLIERGMDPARIVLEGESATTWENVRNAAALLRARDPRPSPRVLVATSDFHLFRARWLARRAGLEAFGVPCPTPWYERPNSMVRECFAIVKSWCLDRPDDAVRPGSDRHDASATDAQQRPPANQ